MAFGKGQESKEGSNFPKYVGVGSFKVIDVNPTKEKLEAIYNTTFDKDVEYINKSPEGIDQVRIDFIVQSDIEKNNNIDLKTKITFFLKKAPKYNKDKTKVQVINLYGETTWIDIELVKKGELPENQSWFEKPYRPCLEGEDELTQFLKVFLNIPVKSWRDKNGVVKTIENKSDAEARLENVEKYFKGEFKELKDIIKFQPDNKFKMALGVKTTDDNKEYQTVYTKMFVKNNVNDFSRLEKAISDSQANGAFSNVKFSVTPLQEYVVTPTNFTQEVSSKEEEDWFNQQ